MRRLLAIMLVTASAPALAVSTTSTTLTTSWQDLGTGPLQLQTNNQSQTLYQIADTAPPNTAGGFFLQGVGQPQTVATTSHVYVRARQVPASGAAPVVIWAPVSAAGGGGGGGGGAITAPVGSNTKAQSVSVTYATDQLLPAFAAVPSFNLVQAYKDYSGASQSIAPATQLPVHDYDQRATSVSLSSASGSFVDIPINGQSVVGLRFAGLAASGATITYLSSNDATQTPASPINSLNASSGVSSGTRTTDGETRIGVSGRTTLRLAVTTGGTGTITVSYNVSRAGNIVDLASPLPPGTNVIGGVLDNVTQWAGVALGAPSAYGTAPTAGAVVPGVNAFVTNFPATQAVSWTNQTVNANLYVAGAANAAGNPAFVQVTNFPTTQAVNQTQINGVAVAVGAGASNTGTQRTVLATDSTIANTGFNALQGGNANTSANPFFVTNTTTGPVAPGTAATNSNLGGLVYNSTAPTLTNGQQAAQQADVNGNAKVNVVNSVNLAAQGAGNTIGSFALNATSFANGVTTISRIPSVAAGTNLTQAKSGATRLYKVYACNTTTTAKYIKFYNATTVTVGTTAILLSRVLPPSATSGVPLCQSFDQADIGWSFATGLAYALTGGNADSDTTALAAGDVTQVSVEYQ